MRKIVTLMRDAESCKNGTWLKLDQILQVGTEINILKPEEDSSKLRIFKVARKKGFMHQVSVFDGRNRVSKLKKGMKFFFMEVGSKS